jgi:threonine/homoserine/homoserine lactone efflux protein
MKLSPKLTSRKLFVFLIWAVLAIASIFVTDMPKETIYQFFGFVSLLYIGSNTAQKWIERKDNLSSERELQEQETLVKSGSRK